MKKRVIKKRIALVKKALKKSVSAKEAMHVDRMCRSYDPVLNFLDSEGLILTFRNPAKFNKSRKYILSETWTYNGWTGEDEPSGWLVWARA